MRVPDDMPTKRRRRRFSGRGRIILIVAIVAIFFLALSLRGLAGFWTDYLWFDSLGLSSVFSGILGAKIALGAIFTVAFFVLCFLSLTVADRLAPKNRPSGPEDELLDRYHALIDRRAGLVRAAVSFVLALIAGVGMSSQWNQWLLFVNGGSFGIKDQTFQTDIGFYVFKLPFYSTVVSWLFASGVIILLVTIVAHYLNGGIRLQSPVQRVTPQVKAHISVILGLLALVKAADYWLQRYALTYSTRGAVDGATYTDVKAQLPAIYLLLFIALLSFGLFIYNIWRRGWVLPVVAVGLWALVSLVAGVAYPAFVQRFQVQPEESSKEAPYIQHNIEATRQGLNMTDVQTQQFNYTQDAASTTAAIDANPQTISNIRLLDPAVVDPTYQKLQSLLGFYQFNNLDVDRYPIATPDGNFTTTQVVLGTRDLSLQGIPQQSWEGTHLAYTHGYGLALAPANTTDDNGSPSFLVADIPVSIKTNDINLTLDKPQTYYGESMPGYAVVDTGRPEIDYQQGGQSQTTSYSGTGGVKLDSSMKKAAFALRFADWNLFISGFVNSNSRIIFQRDIRSRVQAIAPFLSFDADPYPVVHNGRIVYMMDAYTTSDRYPNAQRDDTSGLPSKSGLAGKRFNYVRNSVKVVVDTYDGSVKLYVVDPSDPIVTAYQKAFPKLFSPGDDMPQDLRAHWRYPEDLFRVQTNMWGRYHLTDPQSFYEQTLAWSVAQDPGASVNGSTQVQTATQLPNGQVVTTTSERRIDPYYQLLKLPGEKQEQFVMLRPFVPFAKDTTNEKRTLASFMVAESDPDHYGKLITYQVPAGQDIDGPSNAQSRIGADQAIQQRITLLNQQGSTATYGNMLLVPIGNSIVYVRPLYVSADNNPIPQLKQVIVVSGQQVAMQPTLRAALKVLFPGSNPLTYEPQTINQGPLAGITGSGNGSTSSTTSSSTTSTTTPPSGGQTTEQLIAQADQILSQAKANLMASGDLGAYQAAVEKAQQLINQAAQQSGAAPAPTTTAPAAPAVTSTTARPSTPA